MGPHRRTLLLLRHAKSSWEKADVADLERPLSPRGQRAAAAVGQWIGQRGLAPDRVLCSPARRSQETLALAGGGADDTLSRVGTHFPTAGLAQLGVDAPWEALGPGQAYLEAFVVPKELV